MGPIDGGGGGGHVPAALFQFGLSLKGCSREDYFMSVNRKSERPLLAYRAVFVLVC